MLSLQSDKPFLRTHPVALPRRRGTYVLCNTIYYVVQNASKKARVRGGAVGGGAGHRMHSNLRFLARILRLDQLRFPSLCASKLTELSEKDRTLD